VVDRDLTGLYTTNVEEEMAETLRGPADRFSYLLIDMARFFSRSEPPAYDPYFPTGGNGIRSSRGVSVLG
jgi:uncharacterized RDD family membrane protein YckC